MRSWNVQWPHWLSRKKQWDYFFMFQRLIMKLGFSQIKDVLIDKKHFILGSLTWRESSAEVISPRHWSLAQNACTYYYITSMNILEILNLWHSWWEWVPLLHGKDFNYRWYDGRRIGLWGFTSLWETAGIRGVLLPQGHLLCSMNVGLKAGCFT